MKFILVTIVKQVFLDKESLCIDNLELRIHIDSIRSYCPVNKDHENGRTLLEFVTGMTFEIEESVRILDSIFKVKRCGK